MHAIKDYIRSKIPAQFLYKIVNIKKTLQPGGFYLKSYSGNGEDLVLRQYLFKNKKKGFYVDVGAFHPKHISNTYALFRQQWNGINIDPNKETIDLFNKHRPNDINLQIGIAKTPSKKTYYSFSHSGVNTFSEEHAAIKKSKEWNTLLDTKEIDCYTLAQILEEHLPDNVPIDLLDIDVEGLDLEVLESNNWDRYRPSVILVEDRDFRHQLSQSSIFTFLIEKGYVFHSYMDITLIMIEKDFIPNN